MGPLEFVVIGFDYASFSDAILDEVHRLTDANIIRIVDLAFVRKDFDGTVIGWEYVDSHDGAMIPWLAEAVRDLVTTEGVEQIGADLDPGQGAAVVLFEHVCATRVQASIQAAGGVVLARERISDSLALQVEAEAHAARIAS